MKTLKDAKFKGKKVVLRVDFNVSFDRYGEIVDDRRIVAVLPTIKYLLNAGADKIFIVAHLGEPVLRPKEKISTIIAGNKGLVLAPVAKCLAKLLKIKNTEFLTQEYPDSPLPVYKINEQIYLLENVRFLEGEKKNDPDTARSLAILGDIYVDDAFGVLHRNHASVEAICEFLPSYAGKLVEKELTALNKLKKNPEHPFVVVLGGAKVFDKMIIIKKLNKVVDYFLLGGVMANTFLATRNVDVKQSVIEKKRLDLAEELMNKYARKIILPVDLVWDKNRIVDVKQGTVNQFSRYLQKAKTIFINGTMGLINQEKFTKGTQKILEEMIKNKNAKTLICGGDTIAEADKNHLSKKFSYVSTGGGVTLNYLAGEKLPGLEALDKEME